MKDLLLEQGDIDHSPSWPLSMEQAHIWRYVQPEASSSRMANRYAWKLDGPLDIDALGKSVEAIVRRHDVLRASFREHQGKPVQIIRPYEQVEVEVPRDDLCHLTLPQQEAEVRRYLEGEFHPPFDVANDLLIRLRLLALSDQASILWIQVHQLVADDWTVKMLLQELMFFYEDACRAGQLQWSDFPHSYGRSVQGEETRVEDQEAPHLDYWLSRLGSEPPKLDLPADNLKTHSSYRTNTCHVEMPPPLKRKLLAYCKKEIVSPYLVLLTVLKHILHRYSREEEIRVGTLVDGRDRQRDPGAGVFANVLVLQTLWQEELTFANAVRMVQKTVAEAMAHQAARFPRVAGRLGLASTGGSRPLYRVVLHQSPAITLPKIAGLHVTELDAGYSHEHADLVLKLSESAGSWGCSITYAADLFSKEAASRIAGHVTTLLAGALEDPEASLSSLPILTEAERHQLLFEWNPGRADYPAGASLPELFEEQVRKHPDEVALLFEEGNMTYRELDRRANQIAGVLREKNIAPEQLVAVCLDRSPDMIASYLAVWKAGGAYVPIDLTYPAERIAYMLEDASVSFVITTEGCGKELPPVAATWVYLDRLAKEADMMPTDSFSSSRPDSLAYVMYTSGSTGKPKGVMIEHRGIVRLVKNIEYASVGPNETYLNLGAVAFDVSAFEIYGALLNGGKLVILPTNKPTFAEIARTIQRYDVTSLNVTPDRLNMLLEDHCEALSGLRQVMPGGEALPVWLARKCLEKLPVCRLINLYGPTENAVNTTSYHVKAVPAQAAAIPIGRPIADDRLYILDAHMQPVPVGVIGELYMAGEGVARGYLNRPELTAERFPLDPFTSKTGQRMYKSGDLARYLPNGDVEFIGRADDQVKIRGCRIELGEIETIVGQYPGVRQAVAGVTKAKDGTAGLVAYVVMNSQVIFDQVQLRAYCREKLPDYMIPTFFVELTEIPVTPVGKIDRKRLPEPTPAVGKETFTPPRNEVEKKLAGIWETVLSTGPIGVMDSFFHLGGNSLQAMRMFSSIEKTFQKKLAVSSVFQEDTIEKLARLLTTDEPGKSGNSLVAIQPLGDRPPLFCVHGGGGEVLIYGDLARKMGQEQPVYGLRYSSGNSQSVTTVEEMARKYVREIREVQPSGPYSLIGFCLGGAIAYEMAQQLIGEGEEVRLLAVLNFASPNLTPLTMQEKIGRSLKLIFLLPPAVRYAFLWKKLKFAVGLVKQTFDSSPGEHESLQELVQAVANYRPQRYPGDLLLIRAVTQLRETKHLGWQVTGTGHIDEHVIPADHADLLKEPHVDILIGEVRKRLRGERIEDRRTVV